MKCFTAPAAVRVAVRTSDDVGRAVYEARAFFRTSSSPDGEPLATAVREWTVALAASGGGTLALRHLVGSERVWELVVTHNASVPLNWPTGLPKDAFYDRWAGPRGGAAMLRCGWSESAAAIRFGVAQHAYRDSTFCGDAWVLAIGAGRATALMLDGLGHGPIAATASGAGIAAFLSDPHRPPVQAAAALHAGMAGTVGGVGALASYDLAQKRVDFVGLGDISGRLVGPTGTTRGLASDLGIFGIRQPRFRTLPYEAEGNLLVLHTDGVRDRWRLDEYPGLQRRHPALIAALIHRDFGRVTDDGTILVVDLGAF